MFVKTGNALDEFESIFNITEADGTWLNAEDKDLYNVQVESSSRTGYSTRQESDISTTHPSKRLKSSADVGKPTAQKLVNKGTYRLL